jgi:hypothetical protein
MNYYEQILNSSHCRPWPLLDAAQADDKIAQLMDDVAYLRSQVRSLMIANEELRELLFRGIHK